MPFLLLVVALVALVLGGRWYWRRATLRWAVSGALSALATADSPAAEATALSNWARQTSSDWADRREELVQLLCKQVRAGDLHGRKLLTWLTGADYGDRADDWERWHEAREKQRDEGAEYAGEGGVRLKPGWEARIGLTAWFTTILPLDGQIYVATLGMAYDDPRDEYDGVVRVDGVSGEAAFIFQPSDGPERDIVGLAAGDGCLFAGCRNGVVYCLEPDGTVRWEGRAGAAIDGPPLAIDVNGDGVIDVAVVTVEGRVVAMSGHSGQTIWRTRASGSSGVGGAGAVLTAGNLLGGTGREIVVTTPAGAMRVLAARTGNVLWENTLGAGCLAGTIVTARLRGGSPPAYVADRQARIWTLLRAAPAMQTVLSWDLVLHEQDGIVAGLRTLARRDQPPLVIACVSGGGDWDGSVCAAEPGGVRWRFSPGGYIWAAPALADLNGDKESEIVLATAGRNDAETGAGLIVVLSASGHCLRRITLPAAPTCSPIISDVDGDNELEVLVADAGGWLRCFDTGRMGAVEWSVGGGDSHNTRDAENAYRYGQVPHGVQWRWTPE
ncbi:MAG: PQQ-binding-like beta-propeller repeat protein [Phycisphaerae bacterium]